MNPSIKNILREAIKIAKALGIWQCCSLGEKKEIICYFQDNCTKLHREAAPHRIAAFKAFTIIV